MSIHVCKCQRFNGEELVDEFHLRYPGMTQKQAQGIADKINSGSLESIEPQLANELQAKLVKARSDALEEAAKVCEDGKVSNEDGNDVDAGYNSACADCAREIRALKEKP